MKAFFIFLLFFPLITFSQLIDDFSDTDFTANPAWTGDQNLFLINSNFQLQLNHNAAGTAYLSSSFGLTDSLEWRFSIRLAFSPSATNYARVYLFADNNDLSQNLDGYFLQFGETGSTDAIELFHQKASVIQSVCRGTNGRIAAAFDIDIKVVYTEDGNWSIYIDWDKSGNFVAEANGQSLSEITNPYYGFFCKFTSSNATKFYFDNVNVNYIYKDNESPIVLNTEVVSSNQLRIHFNEALDVSSAEDPQNYSILQSNQIPILASLNSTIPTEVLLEFSNDFPANQSLDILVSNIKDLANNTLENTTSNFFYGHAEFADVVFNEIMADPSPTIGLPETEYLEIYNRASYPIDLTNWKLKIGDAEKVFSSYVLPSHEYLILSSTSQVDTMRTYGPAIGFSSFSLTNSGQHLILINDFDEIIDEVSYTDSWYQDEEKAEGGWSLEKICVDNICLSAQNWKACIDNSGGTPGTQNSVFSDILILPEALSVDLKNDSVIELRFNQKMDAQTLLGLQNYSVDHSFGNPILITIDNNNQSAELLFDSKFSLGIEYQLTLKTELTNCIGENLSGQVVFSIELSKIAEFADVVFNEIMADPSPTIGLPEVEYLEIYNRTPYPINLSSWILKIGDTEKTLSSQTLKANDYLILCSTAKVDTMKAFASTMGFSSFSLPNDEQNLVLMNASDEIIDEVNYTDSWYQDEKKAGGGWSIEKINTDNICLSNQNWKASSSILGGTPGAKNSVFSDILILLKALSVDLKNDSVIELRFNQKMDAQTLLGLQNYSVDHSFGNPILITTDNNNQSAELLFNSKFSLGIEYQLTLKTELTNCIGENLSGQVVFSIELSKIAEFADVVFNEIMADPSPTIGLPEVEYLEIYNRTPYPINLSNWKLKIGDFEKELSNYVLPSNEYLILCSTTKVDTMKTFGSAMGFSSFSLPNDEQNLVLLNASGKIIDEVSYTDSWYQDEKKAGGGWSIEKINTDNICLSEQNWKASSSILGGTPGAQNSVFSDILILTEILSVDLKNDSIISLRFNQKMDAQTLLGLQNYSVDHSIGNPILITIDNNNQSAELLFDSRFSLGIEYQLTLKTELTNCIGQSLSGQVVFSIELSKTAEFADVVFNEIMADPSPTIGLPEVEYLEIYNRTPYPINLSNWILKIGDTEKTLSSQTLKANDYLILCSTAKVDTMKTFGSAMGFSSFSLPNDEQNLILTNASGEIIDEVSYTDSWYQDEKKAGGGWSIEKINTDNICLSNQNWKASSSILGGTPGTQNSVFSDVLILPEVLSVDLKNDSIISIRFNQKMDAQTLLGLQNYSVDHSFGNPILITIDNNNQSAELLFDSKFSLGIEYQLTLKTELTNCMGENLSGQVVFSIELSKTAEFADVVFNEIMADPSPTIGLPEVEYLEIYNRTAYPINLSNWILKIGDFEKELSNYVLPSNEYLILCSTTKVDTMKTFGSAMGFSSFSLPNDEQNLVLLNASGKIIDEVSYTDSWYQDEKKAGGGWSIEKINTDNICLSDQNWKASIDNSGGTPGAKNRVFSDILILLKALSVDLKNDSVIELRFNQKMDAQTLLGLQNYSVDHSFGNPILITIDNNNQSAELLFDSKFSLGIEYQLTLKTELTNCMGQSLSGQVVFSIELSKTAEFADVVFNEIMADPSPTIGLPEVEYLEIYNRTPYPINLSNWILKIGDFEKELSNYVLPSNEYLILCSTAKVDTMKTFGSAMGFSSFSLPNDEQNLVLLNASGKIIDEVSYTDSWYQDEKKADGGWSIEKINTDNICLSEQNWKASSSILGGTPGTQNSVFSDILILPEVLSVDLKNDSIISLRFNQKMDAQTLLGLQNYSVDHSIGNPILITIDNNNQSAELLFDSKFSLGIEYQLTLKTELTNCMGQSLSGQVVFSIELSKTAEFADIVFNEIMADPSPTIELPEVEYLEIYNRTPYPINLSNWILKIGDFEKELSNYVLPSNEYLILCSTAKVDTMKTFGSAMGFSSFSLPNDEQNLVLLNASGKIIDEVSYTDSWYQDEKNAGGGWSIEKINTDNICLSDQNWKASSSILGGTPGAKNSVFSDILILLEALSVDLKNDSVISIRFNQKMDAQTLLDLQNYSVDNSFGNPILIKIDNNNQSVDLLFDSKFSLGIEYQLTLKTELTNCIGENLSGQIVYVFELSKTAEFADVVFNEIMTDPSPTIGLPEVEYLEIYNRTPYPINLSSWKLKIGDFEKELSNYVLPSNEYLILCSTAKVDTMKTFGSAMGFSSFSLPNDEQNLVLLNASGKIIDEVSYTDSWYQDEKKAGGGWSIEKINTDNICLSEQNWKASSSILGGTPGTQNSVFSDILILPEVLSVDLKNDSVISIRFNQKMDAQTLLGLQNYSVDHSIGNPILITTDNNNQSAELLFNSKFSLGIEYQLTLKTELTNCIGENLSGQIAYVFELSKTAEFADVVFNEIMADPSPIVGLPEVEYLEIYNRTPYPINLSNWKLKIGDFEKELSNYVLPSNEYLILCSTAKVDTMKAFASTMGFSSFSLPNDEQNLVLLNASGEIIDEVNYTDSWYQDEKKAGGGWSIEKINTDNICLSNQNWKAGSSILGGTPGTQNSVFSDILILPEVLSVDLKNDSIISIRFNQKMDAQTLLGLQNYSVDHSFGNPILITIDNNNQSAELLFDSKFSLGIEYQLTLKTELTNCMGENLSGQLNFTFELSKTAEYGDVLIHEIMADPEPSQGLPEAEYIELYNRTKFPVSLSGWSLSIGNSKIQFPKITIPANGFLILTNLNKIGFFNTYGNVLTVPSFGLSNGGTSLDLKNNDGQIIHCINFQNNWYNDTFKAEGGWSLEMISSNNFCEQSINWSASQNPQGGTPGKANSLSYLHPDYPSPRFEAIDVINQNTLLLHFSKSMDSLALRNPQNYSADNDLGSPAEIKTFAPEYRTAEISFVKSFAENTIYQLNINPALFGCCGSELQNLNKFFALPQEPEAGDIIINEILFDAWNDDGEYVELYNRSDKIIDNRKLLFSRYNTDAYDTSYYSVQLNTGQFFPNEYMLLCKNKASVLDVYYSTNPDVFYAFDNFSALPNTEGKVLLSKSSNKSFVIDAFNYNQNMHHVLINNAHGVSLERLSFGGETNKPNNWTSATANVNYGTPGYQNSQFQTEVNSEEIINLDPEIFSPDLDGFNDLLQINYHFSQSGYTLNLMIFNAQGQRIRHLVKNELMGISGQLFWDGTTEKGDKAVMGIYILYFEYFDQNGRVEKMKKTCVLGGRL